MFTPGLLRGVTMGMRKLARALTSIAQFFALIGVAYIELSFVFREVIRALNPNRKDE